MDKKPLILSETKHSMKRRPTWHDYSRPGLYMLTLAVEGREPLLGRLAGDEESAHIELTALGREIEDVDIKRISKVFPQVVVRKLCIMPDHIHIIIWVKEHLPKGKHLGQVIAGFKGGCSRAAQKLREAEAGKAEEGRAEARRAEADALATVTANRATNGTANRAATVTARGAAGGAKEAGMAEGAVTVGSASAVAKNGGTAEPARATAASEQGLQKIKPLFEQGYNDKILLDDGQLDRWKHYLDDNPRRLMVKRHHRERFTLLTDLDIAGVSCQAVGNRFLLDIPDKVAVIVHRCYTEEVLKKLREEWLECGERGGVIVSAAIAPKEKEILREAMDRGYRIILLRENGFPEFYKPSGEAFDACADGRLLQISPWEFHTERKTITREQCLYLNHLVERLTL